MLILTLFGVVAVVEMMAEMTAIINSSSTSISGGSSNSSISIKILNTLIDLVFLLVLRISMKLLYQYS